MNGVPGAHGINYPFTGRSLETLAVIVVISTSLQMNTRSRGTLFGCGAGELCFGGALLWMNIRPGIDKFQLKNTCFRK